MRAYLCSAYNSNLTISFGGERKPVNKVLLGRYHTLHQASGEIADQTFWYDPNAYGSSRSVAVELDKIDKLRADVVEFYAALDSSPFSKLIERSLVRWVNAFDTVDYDSAIISTWASLESLLSLSAEKDNSKIPKRCANLYQQSDFARQVIEHIRDYRNSNVHRGETSDEPKTICYQLQRYFLQTVFFMLSNAKDFETHAEMLEFLDLPNDEESLNRRLLLLAKAKNFYNPPRADEVSKEINDD
ncbi:MAG: hypothetical protein EOP06_27030 [Proteobacteria bacterium]|nr:MAG: hypothetical protein EOP06_27030 [Pseudomonadota bacterium]